MGRIDAVKTARELVALATGNPNQCGQYSHEEVREISQAVLDMDEERRWEENPVVKGVREALAMAEGKIAGLTGLGWMERCRVAEQEHGALQQRLVATVTCLGLLRLPLVELLAWYNSDGINCSLSKPMKMVRAALERISTSDALDDLQRLGQEYDAAPMLGSDRVVHSCQDGTPCEFQNQCDIGYCARACDDLAMSAMVGLEGEQAGHVRTPTEVRANAAAVDPTFRAKLDELYPDHGVCIAKLCDEYLDPSGKLLGEIRRMSFDLRHPLANPLRVCEKCGQANRSCICGRTGS